MPTRHQRHTITEVGPVAEALGRVRSVAGRADLRELVILGAEAFIRREEEHQGSEEARSALRERLIARSTTPGAIDREAADAVREHGFSRAGHP